MASKKVRGLVSEYLGSFTLGVAVIGSGLMAQSLTDDRALMLVINVIGTVFGLAIAISIFLKLGQVTSIQLFPCGHFLVAK